MAFQFVDTTFDFLFRIINPAFLLFGFEVWFDFCYRQFFICFYLKVWFVDAFAMVSPITVDLASALSIFASAPCFWLFLFHHITRSWQNVSVHILRVFPPTCACSCRAAHDYYLCWKMGQLHPSLRAVSTCRPQCNGRDLFHIQGQNHEGH